jgi:aminopeptidase N
MQTTELIVTARTGFEVLSNGTLVAKTDNADTDTTTWHWKQDQPHVAYLVSLVVGKFAVQRDTWRDKPVTYYVPPDRADDIERSFGKTKRMLDFFSERIDYEYPWDKYAQVVVEQFIIGGMENTSATTLTERTLHDYRAHLDYSSDGLVAHELAHQWFGDLLTCANWTHIWLNEGFASYFEAIWAEHDEGTDAFAFNMFEKAESATGGDEKHPVAHRRWHEPWDQFDVRAYPKGAWLLHMIRRSVGDERFWEIIRTYTRKHAHRPVETVDLRKVCEDVTGRSFERFFHDWTERPGHPKMKVDYAWQADDKLARIDVKQTQDGEAFHVPVKLALVTKDGAEPIIVEHAMHEKAHTFHVPLPSRPVRFRFDPGFSVLKEETVEQGRDLWIAQLTDDPDPVGRILAARHLGKSHADAETQALIDALKTEPFWGVQGEICAALGEAGGKKARDALIEALKLEHPKARRRAAEALSAYRDESKVLAALRLIVEQGDASYYVEAAAIESYAKHRPTELRTVLEPVLDRPSHNEVVRRAALQGLTETLDPQVTETLIAWSARDKPRACRDEALGALAQLTRKVKLPESVLNRVVQTLTAHLSPHETPRIRRAAVEALRDLGGDAYPAVEALETLAKQDAEGRVRTAAKDAIQKIRAVAPVQPEVKQLRKELDEIKKTNEKLQERITELEGKTAK